MFLPSNAVRLARKRPRRPDFLLEPLQSQRPLRYGTLGGRVKSHDPGLPLPRGLRVGGPLSFLLRILQLDQLLPSLCSGLRC